MLIKLGVATRIVEILNRDKVDSLLLTDKSFFQRYAAIRQGWELDPTSYLYMRTRMVSALEKHGANANGDAFLAKELARRYATFINSAVNIDHDNDGPEKAVGFVVDARYLPEDMYVEGVHAIEKMKAEAKKPGIIMAIEKGVITDTSMGCFVEHSICSECLREAGWDGKDFGQIEVIAYSKLAVGKGIATVPEEYCHHLGRYGEKKGGDGGPFEINCGVTFFEDSIITTAGADKDAKYLEKLAASLDLSKMIIASPFAGKLKGGIHVGQEKTAEGLKLDTQQEKGDYPGTPSDKDKALYDQSKGKSETTKPGGDKMETMEEKKDYTLASKQVIEAIALVKKLAADNPEVKDLIFDQKEIGGVPKAVQDGKKEQHQDKVDDANTRKEGDVATEVPVEKAPLSPEEIELQKHAPVKNEGKKKHGILSAVADFLKKMALEMDGNPTETVEEKGDYMPKTGDPDQAYNSTQKKTAPKETDMKGNPVQTQVDAPEYPHTGAAKPVPKATVADNEKAKVDHMVSSLQTGKSYEDAKKDATEKFDGDRSAARRKMADDMNRGSMGSPGRPDTLTFKAEEEPKPGEKPEQKLEDGKEKTAMDQPNETTDKRLNEGTDEKIETAPIRTDAGKKKADGVPPQFQKKEEPKKEGPPVAEKPMEKTEGIGCTADGVAASPVSPAPAAESAPMVKEDEATPEKSKDMVEKMDHKAEALEAVMNMKKNQASLLAQSGYKLTAAVKVKDIQFIEGAVENMDKLANSIEELSNSSIKLEGETKKAVVLNLRKMMGFARKLMAETDKIMDDMKKKDKEDSEKVEAAVRFAQEKKEKVAAQKSEAETKSRLTAMVKSTAIRELVKVGIRKGLVPSSELQSKIAELSKLSDVEFEATKKVWASLPDAMSTPKGSYVPRNVREASRPAGAGLSLTDGSTQKLGGSLEDGTLFGTDHL
jgi:hypothetical protein